MKDAFCSRNIQSFLMALTLFCVFLLISPSCGVQAPGSGPSTGSSHATGPVVVYKTELDYRDHVSVQLSEDGRSVIAYPGPGDVTVQRPVELANGYLLKRMVGNAYLSLSIEEYASTAHTYTAEELFDLVIDKKPFLEIYDCSECSRGDTASINQLIRQEKLYQCKSLRQ